MTTQTMAQTPFDVRDGGSFLLDAVGETRIFTAEDLAPEQLAIARTARSFADAEVLPRIEQIEAKEPGLMRELLEKAGELGLLMLDIPEQYGGLGHDKTTTMLMTETFNHCASFAVSLGAHIGIGTLPLLYFGTPEQKRRYLPKLATGEWIAAYALTEPGSGSDALAARTRAELSADGLHYRLNGSKQWITNAGFADLFVVFAKIDGEHFTAFLVERSSAGLSVGPEEKKHGIEGSSTCGLGFDDVLVPRENLLGEIGKGHHIAFNILNLGRARLGIGCLGGAKAALGMGAEYAIQRRQFDKALSEFGMIRAKLGESACRIFAGQSLGYRTAGLLDKRMADVELEGGEPSPGGLQKAVEEYAIETSILKIVGSEVVDFVVDEALQIHGGYGYMVEYGLERARRDARINRIFEGTNEINRLLAGGTLLRRAMQQRLDLMAATSALESDLEAGREPAFDPASPRLAEEQRQVQRMKSAMIFATSHAVRRYMMAIEEEQEVLAAMADMLIDIYAADSAIARTLQYPAQDPQATFFEDCSRLYVEQAAPRVLQQARSVLCRSLEGEALEVALERLGLLDRPQAVDLIGLRDRVAAVVIEAAGWPAR
jgi:alkylation response protein AidB-like acyl-CoA dehydrogenase